MLVLNVYEKLREKEREREKERSEKYKNNFKTFCFAYFWVLLYTSLP